MIVGHNKNLQYLKDIVNRGNYSHAYLFSGPDRTGKTKVAEYFAQSLLCEQTTDDAPCGKCSSCKLFGAGNQPDFLFYDGYDNLNVEEVRELVHFLELKPYQSPMKVAVIAHVERMSTSAANSFLKTLEEPAPNTLIILTSENSSNLLPTIVSRTQVVGFGFVPTGEIQNHIANTCKVASDRAEDISNFSAGKIGLAIELAENPGKMDEIRLFLKNFLTAMTSRSYSERLLEAEGIADMKDRAMEFLSYAENYYQTKIGSEITDKKELLKIATQLDKIAQSKEYILKNVNLRLVLESLLLQGA